MYFLKGPKFSSLSVNMGKSLFTKIGNILDFKGDSIIREVELLGNSQVMVFARSVIPITNDTEDLLMIGSRPLGEVLFNDSTIARGPLQITHTGSTWGRRSAFTIGTTKLLVNEFFLRRLYA